MLFEGFEEEGEGEGRGRRGEGGKGERRIKSLVNSTQGGGRKELFKKQRQRFPEGPTYIADAHVLVRAQIKKHPKANPACAERIFGGPTELSNCCGRKYLLSTWVHTAYVQQFCNDDQDFHQELFCLNLHAMIVDWHENVKIIVTFIAKLIVV